ncbi:adenosylcobinamide amidohydrolase [Ancylobacter sp. 3268]|uniref:adenosylcobinamide amidohydrolase n=1 Tax=Ancylobacter sp. 3268 TaxID=2817752 RepID=UPI002855A0D5|nr:adenosylcobinamide amidohydrolase [Ancylobacter sp. 3268]MDR6951412.1 adenosylcobinamide amidohydrolase [Ancylobacter sp. 3268]
MNPMLDIRCERPWLVLRLAAPHRMVSWSLNRPGLVEATAIAWRQVATDELTPELDPAGWFANELATAGLEGAVGLITARDIATHVHRAAEVEGARADCVVTAGLNNGERIGHRHAAAPALAGTVNIVCRSAVPLTEAALLEAASLVAQARTVAIMEAGYRRPGGRHAVTGTGTDCIVMAAPVAAPMTGAPQAYAGMHTAIGEAIGACVHEATRLAVAQWIAARG